MVNFSVWNILPTSHIHEKMLLQTSFSSQDCIGMEHEFFLFVVVEKDECMIGVTWNKHKQIVSGKIQFLQNEDKIPRGKISFSPLKAVGTDCIHGDPDEFVHLDINNPKN